MWSKEITDELIDRREKIHAGDPVRCDKQHASGKLTARERLLLLFDGGRFTEIGSFAESSCTDFGMDRKKAPGDGVITGFGTVGGRTVYVAAQDFTVMGGSLGETHARKIAQVQNMALEALCPFVLICDSGGARIEEGVLGLAGYGDMFTANVRSSGVIPQIAVMLGPCAGGSVYGPALMDFVIVNEATSRLFVTGPQVVESVLGEKISAQELGGAQVHTKKSGVAHVSCADDEECIYSVKRLLSYLPGSAAVTSCRVKNAELTDIVPENRKKPYDMHAVIEAVCDEDSFFELQRDYAPNIIIGFCRFDCRTVGVVANQPAVMGGSLDCASAEKAARFVRFCDCFGIPILSLTDVPAFMPGSAQEHGGLIRRGAKMLYAFAEATVPRVNVIIRKAYGGAFIAMNSKQMGCDVTFAWPIAEIAVMGGDGAVHIMYRKEIEAASDPAACIAEKTAEYSGRFSSPFYAARHGFIDEVILPGETREKIISSFAALSGKPGKTGRSHGNIPL